MAVSFTGNTSTNRVELPDSAALTLPNGEWCIAGWMRKDSTQPTTRSYIIGYGRAGNVDTFDLYEESGVMKVYWRPGSGFTLSTTIDTSIYEDDLWHHWLVQYDGTNFEYFLDGGAVKFQTPVTPTDTTDATQNSGILTLNQRADLPNFRVSAADYAEWAKWDRSFNAGERDALAAGLSPDAFPGSRMWYLPLIDGPTTVCDKDNPGLTCTISGATAENHPPIFYRPKSQQMLFTVEAGGTPTLVIQDVSQAQSLDNVTLTQAHTLAVAELAQAQTLDNVTLTQANVLAVAELAQGQSLDNVTLTQAHIIAVNDLDQAQTIDNVTLTIAGTISPNPLDQAQTIDEPVLTVAHNLAVQDIAQGQTIDAVTLTQHYILAVAELTQGQLIDNVTATVGALAVNDLLQGQNIDAVSLTEHAVLAVDSLTQAQIIDIVNLGGLVIGSLDGTLVAYALIDGEIVTRTLLSQSGITVN